MGWAAAAEDLLRRAERQGRRRVDRRGGSAALSAADCRIMKWVALVLLAVLLVAPSARASDRHPSQAELEGEVMCPVCGTTLDQSDSPAAQQIKRVIAERIAAGDSKSEIKRRLVAEYGPAILAAPPHKGFGLLARCLPVGGCRPAAGSVRSAAWR